MNDATKFTNVSSSSSVATFEIQTSPSSSGHIELPGPVQPKPAAKLSLVDAVYWQIRAMRALGRETLNASEIASALGVSLDDVARAVHELQEKGVKVAA